MDDLERTRIDVVFRDAEGGIVGGVFGDDYPRSIVDQRSSVEIRRGSSVHHFNLAEPEIPEGADLAETELGPGGSMVGG